MKASHADFLADIGVCTGCGACAQNCPWECIKMESDPEGFLYPKVDNAQCNRCGLCSSVCPEFDTSTVTFGAVPKKCIAAVHKDTAVLVDSSSGGAFTGIVQTLAKDCIVIGAEYDKSLRVVHAWAEADQSTERFRRSKYVQSDTSRIYRITRDFLSRGKEVMFTGTPCQVAGLKSFLGSCFPNLLCVETLCHGVPSPGVFARYLEYLGARHGSRVAKFDFRVKRTGVGMWRDFLVGMTFEDGRTRISRFDLYTECFLSSLLLRKSCKTCRYARPERVSDIVIGDFWGIEDVQPQLDVDRGVSLVIAITDKGHQVISKLSRFMYLSELPFACALAGNRALSRPSPINPSRDAFFKDYEHLPVVDAMRRFVPRRPLWRQAIALLPTGPRTMLRRLKRSLLG